MSILYNINNIKIINIYVYNFYVIGTKGIKESEWI